MRQFTAGWAARAGLTGERCRDLVAAVSELAANTLAHTTGDGLLTVSLGDGEVICEIRDSGWITDPEPGMTRPDPAAAGGKRGLWLVRHLADEVDIRSGPSGTTVRVIMRVG